MQHRDAFVVMLALDLRSYSVTDPEKHKMATIEREPDKEKLSTKRADVSVHTFPCVHAVLQTRVYIKRL